MSNKQKRLRWGEFFIGISDAVKDGVTRQAFIEQLRLSLPYSVMEEVSDDTTGCVLVDNRISDFSDYVVFITTSNNAALARNESCIYVENMNRVQIHGQIYQIVQRIKAIIEAYELN